MAKSILLWRRDARSAMRAVRRSRILAMSAILLLGISLGLYVVGVVIAHAVLRRSPAGVRNPGSIRRFKLAIPSTSDGSGIRPVFSYPEVAALRRVFGSEEVGAYTEPATENIIVGGHTTSAIVSLADASYFRVVYRELPTVAADPDSAVTANSALPAVVSDSWSRATWGTTESLGRQFLWRDHRFVVAAVLRDKFSGVALIPTDIWLPLRSAGEVAFGNGWTSVRELFPLTVVTRLPLTDGIRNQALRALRVYADNGPTDPQLIQLTSASLTTPSGPHETQIAAIAKLMLATGIVILIVGCVDAMVLFRTQAIMRRPVVAVKIALGARQSDLRRQMAAEAALVLFGATLIGVITGTFGSAIVWRYLMAQDRFQPQTFAWISIRYAVYGALCTAVAVAILIASETARTDDLNAMRDLSQSTSVKAQRMLQSLCVCQASFTALMLLCAAVFFQSIRRADAVDIGFDPENVIAVVPEQGGSAGGDTAMVHRKTTLLAQMATQLRGDSLFDAVSLTSSVPFVSTVTMPVSFGDSAIDARINGMNGPFVTRVDSSYFRALHISISEKSRTGINSNRIVALINRGAASAIWPHGIPDNACVKVGYASQSCSPLVGTTNDVHQMDLTESGSLNITLIEEPQKAPSFSGDGVLSLLVHVRGDRTRAIAVLDRALLSRGIRGGFSILPLRDVVRAQTRGWRLASITSESYGAMTLILTIAGLFCVQDFIARNQYRRLCIEAALGAPPIHLARRAVIAGIRPAIIGSIIGVLTYAAIAGVIAPLLFDTSPWDWPAVTTALAVMTLGSGMALVPLAARAAGANPLGIIRRN